MAEIFFESSLEGSKIILLNKYLTITNNNRDNKGITMITNSLISTVFNLDDRIFFYSSWEGSKVKVLNDSAKYQMITNNNNDNKGITMITKSLISTFHHLRVIKFGMQVIWPILITSAK